MELGKAGRDLVGKSEQDLVMFGDMRNEKEGVSRKTPCFPVWPLGGWSGGSSHWDENHWIKWVSPRLDFPTMFHNQFHELKWVRIYLCFLFVSIVLGCVLCCPVCQSLFTNVCTSSFGPTWELWDVRRWVHVHGCVYVIAFPTAQYCFVPSKWWVITCWIWLGCSFVKIR